MPRKKESFTISYRVDSAILTQLEKGAAPYGISVHEYARQQLLEKLENKGEARILGEIKATRGSVDDLQNAIAMALQVILMNTTQTPPETIRDWINTHFRQSDGE